MDKVASMLTNFDFFGQPIELILQSNNRFRTAMGGFSSILLLIMFILIVGQAIIDLLQRTQFQVFHELRHLDEPEVLLDEFMLGARITQQNGMLVKGYFVELQKISCGANGKCDQTSVYQMMPCEKSHFQDKLDQKIGMEILWNSYYCLSSGSSLKLLSNESLQITISMCEFDDTECWQGDTAGLKPSINMLELIITDNGLNPYQQQISQPFLNGYYRYPFVIGSQQPNVDLYVRSNTINEERSIFPLLSERIYEEVLSISADETINSNVNLIDDAVLARINLKPSWTKGVIQKSYYRVDQMMAYLGGLMKLVIFLFGLVIVFYNRFSLYVYLANKLYTFNVPLSKDYLQKMNEDQVFISHGFSYDMIANKIKDRISKAQSVVEAVKKGTKRLLFVASGGRSNLTPQFEGKGKGRRQGVQADELTTPDQFDRQIFLDGTFNDLLSQDTGIKMAFRYLITVLFCKRVFFKNNVRLQLIDRAVQMITADLDILVIMDRLQEIEKLKRLLLTDTQIQIFDYAPKPVIRAEKANLYRNTINFKSEQSLMTVTEIKRQKTLGYSTVEIAERAKKVQTRTIRDKRLKFDSKDALLQLYHAYNKLSKENQQSNNEEFRKMNFKLMDLLGHQIVEIFETSTLLYDPQEQYLENYRHYIAHDRYLGRRLKMLQSNEKLLVSAIHSKRMSNEANINTSVPRISMFGNKRHSAEHMPQLQSLHYLMSPHSIDSIEKDEEGIYMNPISERTLNSIAQVPDEDGQDEGMPSKRLEFRHLNPNKLTKQSKSQPSEALFSKD